MILRRIATRVGRANLRGLVRLHPADPADETFWATLTALEGNQSVIEEQFADQELVELADAMAFATDDDFDQLEFRLEELNEKYVVPLHHVLEMEGVTIDTQAPQPDQAADRTD
jgi:hypothetical protein